MARILSRNQITACDWRSYRGAMVGVVGLALLGLVAAAPAAAQDTAADYRSNCLSCHSIGGGRLVGPDLKDVTQRQERAWLKSFIRDPKAVIDRGDPHATQMLKDYGGVVMPTLPGMTDARLEALLDLIEAESQLPKSQFQGMQFSERVLGPEDVARGRAIFVGQQRLTAAGTACIACHRVDGLSGMGGGTLGPDLTKVYERLGGRKGLSAWMSAPATPTMAAVFAGQPLESEEIESLVAYLQDRGQGYERAGVSTSFVALGLAGAAAMLALLNQLWRNRLRGVRRPMIQAAALRGE